MDWFVFVIGAILSESIAEYIIMSIPIFKKTWQKMLLSVIIGLIIAFSFGADLMKEIGVEVQIPYVGIVFTGIVISRGSNFFHDFMKKIAGGKEQAREIETMMVRPANEVNAYFVSHEV